MEDFNTTFEKKGKPGENFVQNFINNNFENLYLELTRPIGYCLFDGWLYDKANATKERIEIKSNYKNGQICLEMTHINTVQTCCTGWWLKEITNKNIDVFFFDDGRDNIFVVYRDDLADYYFNNIKKLQLQHRYFDDAFLYIVDVADLENQVGIIWLMKDGINLVRKDK